MVLRGILVLLALVLLALLAQPAAGQLDRRDLLVKVLSPVLLVQQDEPVHRGLAPPELQG
jgi:hypothetical protein